MATTTPTHRSGLVIALDQIRVPVNVRDLDQAHVDALAGSIALQGMLVPVVLTPTTGGVATPYTLVAGFHRVAAAHKLGLREVPAVIRDSATSAADRAVENVTRLQLDAYQEAVAVRAMLEKGLTEAGAAQALGWPRQRVAARVKLLELPEQAQRMLGAGTIPLSAVDQLRTIGEVSPQLLDAVIAFLSDGNEWAAERLTREPGWVIDAALRDARSGVFAAHLTRLDSHEISGLKLGKKTEALLEEATRLHKQIDRYAYGAPQVRFSDADVDQARAAGVIIEFDASAPVIVDRPVYREPCKQAIKRTVEELRAAADTAARERTATKAAGQPEDPEAQARREKGRALRALAEQAHGANLDLGWALRNNLATVDPADLTVARLFVFGLLADDCDENPYTQTGDRVAELAARGVRLVVEEFRTDVTKTRKDGSRGAMRIDYGDPRKPRDAVAWIWKWLDGARTAGDLLWQGDRRPGGGAVRQPARGPLKPAASADALALAQGPRPQSARKARRPAPPRDPQTAREGRREGARRARHPHPSRHSTTAGRGRRGRRGVRVRGARAR